jgi:hypothetical protein
MTDRRTRAERMARPRLQDLMKAVAVEHGACTRPVQLRKTNVETSDVEQVLVPCGATLSSICSSCAERNKVLRAAQCREGWHLDTEPVVEEEQPGDHERWLAAKLAELDHERDLVARAGGDVAELTELMGAVAEELRRLGIRGRLRSTNSDQPRSRRTRSTRRRQDATELPKRNVAAATVGRVYISPDGQAYRPSMFVTLTCDSYGSVGPDGVPTDPDGYDYQRAARDAIHFAAAFDRFIQNLRRVAGFDVQYFAAVEPQRRLAPHVHLAIRGTLPRADLRKIIAATYHQVWWPKTDVARFEADHQPLWDEPLGRYVDASTGELLPTWEEALDAIGPSDDPLHVARFGPKFDAQGVLAGSKDSARCIGYLTKYLVKDIGTCYQPETAAQHQHVARLVDALRFEPCSPTCANWLRYGINPAGARKGLVPGACTGKAHRADHLGYAGRRVLVSRKWSGKTLADHRGDRKTWLMAALGIPATGDSSQYKWDRVTASDPDYLAPPRRLIRIVAERMRWKQSLDEARRRLQDERSSVSVPKEAA